ncbi:MAG: threonine ammonia-lyase [Longimicrobiales bacterium]|nr:threonine ammonia-lyase [Longimicrobiales bacterium]
MPTARLSVAVDDVRAARERLEGVVVSTPTPKALALADLVACKLHLKLENLQRTGSFKDRGALNRLLDLTPEQRTIGIVTASAGNHAQAVAYHAQRLGIPCTVVMPETAPLVKVTRTLDFGARVMQSGSVLDDAAVEARRLVEDEGLTMIHPFDDPSVIAGQGTIGLELVEQIPELDTIIVPVGGGGLISGIAIAAKAINPSIRVIGVEVEAAPSTRASLDAGRIVKIASADTIADGIATKQVGEHTFPIIQALVDDLVVVGEEETARAVLLLLERQRTVVEGGGAVGLAALSTGRIDVRRGERVALVISGGNIDINRIARIIDRGLVFDGRLARLQVRVPDRPGSLARLTRIVAGCGASVQEIVHRRSFADISVGDVGIVLHIETRDREHIDEVIAALEADGLAVEERN